MSYFISILGSIQGEVMTKGRVDEVPGDGDDWESFHTACLTSNTLQIEEDLSVNSPRTEGKN